MFPESDILCSFVCIYFTENFLSKLIRSLNSKWATFPKKRGKQGRAPHIFMALFIWSYTEEKKMTARKKVQGLHVGELYYINIY